MLILSEKKCLPCEGGVAPLKGKKLLEYAQVVGSEWKVVNDLQLERVFKFKDFKEALSFANKVGAIAEEEQHHPDIELGWGRVKITLWTHAINGLSENDFIIAAKINHLTA